MLHGRVTEEAELSGLLDRAAQGHGGALVVRGVAGVGKSALLENLPGAATALRVCGVETETGIPLAALERLVRPVSHRLDALPTARAAALREVLGLGGPAGDQHHTGLALLELLDELSGEEPLLCLVDDAHLLDRASADTLLFAARRLGGHRVAMVFAAEPEFEAPGVPELALEGLDPASASALLDGTDPPPRVGDRIIAESEGNPLALLEFVAAMPREQLLCQVPPPAVLPASPRVLNRFGHRMAALPEAALPILTVIASEQTGELARVMSAAALLGLSEANLAAAEDLLRVSATRVAFRHPLMRSAAYYLTPLAERLRVHRALADTATNPQQRIWHEGAIALGPNEELATELEAIARRTSPARAACLYDHAAQLSPERAERARRSQAATRALLISQDYERALPRLASGESGPDPVRAAMLVGDDATARSLADRRVAELREEGMVGALPEALELLARAQIAEGDYPRARASLEEAARASRGLDRPHLNDLLDTGLARIAAVQGGSSGSPGLLNLGLGRYGDALEHLEAEWQGPDRHDWMTTAADLVEAAVRAGSPERAAEPLHRFEAWARAGGQDWARAVALRCQALTAADAEAGDLFAEAVRLHERGGRPFERARTEFLYGQWLRRARRRSEARSPLRSAARIFADLGATPWEERTRAELRAAGERAADGAPNSHPLERLTPQEQRIVRLAARGVSNRAIADQLYLSPRTVEYHLYKAYPKLGVSSRRELARFRS